MDFSFSITAMKLADILQRTLTSFNNNLSGINLKKCDVYINIDPVPEETKTDDVIAVASKFFKNVIHNCPDTPNFTKAVNWCWKNANSEYLFHLEDDWGLKGNVDVAFLVKELFANKKVKQISLRAYPHKYRKVCLSPSIMKKELYKSFVDKFDFSQNPEIQLRRAWVNKFTNVAYPSRRIIIKDIGRGWMAKSPYKKSGKKKFEFNRWEKR